MTQSALESLHQEHKLIARVLAAAESYAGELEQDPRASLGDLGAFARFFTDFAELWHHAKEEEFLLPALVQHGSAWYEGPISRTRLDHEQEKYLTSVLVQLASQVGPRMDEAEHRREAVAALRAFVAFQRQHMAYEETSLYPLAAERLSESARGDIERRSRELEARRFGGAGYLETCGAAEVLIRLHPPRARLARPEVIEGRGAPHRAFPICSDVRRSSSAVMRCCGKRSRSSECCAAGWRPRRPS